MVKVTVFTRRGKSAGFLLKGHAEQGAYGEDIVCAGISAITQTAILGITEVLKVKAEVSLREGYALCLLSEDVSGAGLEKAQVVLDTMEAGLQSIAQGYPKALKLSHREV